MIQRPLIALALCLLAAGPAAAACTTPSLVELTPVDTGHDAHLFAVGDLDRDGFSDVATTSGASDEIRVIRGDGYGAFSAHVAYPVTDPGHIIARDVNGDQWPDLVVNVENTKIAILLNDGDGTFAAAVSYEHDLHLVQSIDAADFDGDSDVDLLVADLGTHTGKPDMRVLWNSGAGAFSTRTEFYIDHGSRGAVPGDFDKDGRIDFAVAYANLNGGNPGGLLIYLNSVNGFPTTPNHTYTFTNTSSTIDLASADFNGDGDLDLVVSFWEAFQTYRGSTNGTFLTGGSMSFAGSMPTVDFNSVTTGDFNEDGKTDVALGSQNTSQLIVVPGMGNSNFTQPLFKPISYSHFSDIVTADYNNDGRPDLMLFEYDTDEVRIFANACASRYSTTSITSSANPSTFGQNVTIHVTVAGRGGVNVPTGDVALYRNGSLVSTTTLTPGDTNATASFTLSNLALGSHTIRVDYLGNGGFGASSSANLNQEVLRPPFGPPPGFTAARNGSTIAIHMSWIGVENATGYEVFRLNAGAWVSIGEVIGEAYADLSVPNDTPQVYAVRALMTGGAPSALSTPDVANIHNYSSILPVGSTIQAAHWLEMRTMVNALRAQTGLAAFAFTDASLAGVRIKSVHLTELRTALQQAFTQVGMPAPGYTQPSVTPGVTRVRALDLVDLRNALH